MNYLKSVGLTILIWLPLPRLQRNRYRPYQRIQRGKYHACGRAIYLRRMQQCPEGDNSDPARGKHRISDLSCGATRLSRRLLEQAGWEDPYSQAKFTDRQALDRALYNNQRSIYTPEIVGLGAGSTGPAAWFSTRSTLHNRKTADGSDNHGCINSGNREVVADLADTANEADTRLPEMFCRRV